MYIEIRLRCVAYTIWTLWEKEISFYNVLLICEKHYTSGILGKIMSLIQFLFHMLIHKALVQLSVTNRYGCDLNLSMNQASCSCARIVHYTSSILVKIMHLSQLFFLMLKLKMALT